MVLQEEWLISLFLCRTFAPSKVLLQSVCAAPAKQRMNYQLSTSARGERRNKLA